MTGCWLMSVLSGCSTKENTSLNTLGHVMIHVDADLPEAEQNNISLTIASADGRYAHTWSDYKDFSPIEGLYAGPYTAKAVWGKEGAEGFDCPCLVGSADFEVKENAVTDVNLHCGLSQATVRFDYSEGMLSHFMACHAIVHTQGHAYISAHTNESRPAYITPGTTQVQLFLQNQAGRTITISPEFTMPTQADTDYIVRLGYTGEAITVACGSYKSSFPFTDAFFDSLPPAVECKGFVSSQPVALTEGFPSSLPLVMEVVAESGINSLIMTAVGLRNAPEECDLLGPGAQKYIEFGLRINQDSDSNVSVDFSKFIENITVNATSDLSFMLQAEDRLGRVSDVAVLSVSIHGVNVKVEECTKAVVGIDDVSLTLGITEPSVEIKDFSLYIDDGVNPPVPVEILSGKSDNKGGLTLHFKVPAGVNAVPLRVDYMGKSKLRTSIQRTVPPFDLKVDAFATSMMILIKGETPEITAALTRYAHISINGNDEAILERDPSIGSIYCAGFRPSTLYNVEAIVIEGDFSPKRQVRTEVAAEIPDGDFEDVKPIFEYPRFPSGGVYSSTSFPIFNQQNFTDINVRWPKKTWASINQKTFCTKADNRNSWYMQPSAEVDYDSYASGTKSIKLTSVGWSLHGKEIDPYVQPVDGKVTHYNMNYPPLDNISAGYLFLGDYSFDAAIATEVYSQGIKFGSRPSSLNGFFKYKPDENTPTDCGWVKVEILNVDASGKETILSEATMEFSIAPDFRAFNLPLAYDVFFVPATKVRLMFCSSVASEGPSLTDPEVPVSIDIPNARFRGSSLWIDNLSFSY